MMLTVRDVVYFKISTWLFLRCVMKSMNRHNTISVLSQQQGGVQRNSCGLYYGTVHAKLGNLLKWKNTRHV